MINSLLPPPGPTRTLAAATLVNTAGNGLFMTAGVLFFTRSVGLTAAQVGIGLTIAGVVGLFVGVPAGHLADVRGAREVLVVLVLVEGLATAAYVGVHSFVAFLVVTCVQIAAGSATSAVRGGLIAGVVTGEGRVRTRAYLRSVTNVGISVGSVFAGLALHYDSRTAYLTVLLADALSFGVTALILLRLPHVVPAPAAKEGPRLVALRDRPFVAVMAVNAVLTLHFSLLEIAMPLWVVQRTAAPRWIVAVLFLVNTVSVVLLQVRLTRGADDVSSAARTSRRSGVLLLVACALFAAAAGRSADVAVALLVAAAFVQVLGEMLQSAGAWGVGFGLAPAHLQGQYQGVQSTGFAAANMLAPIVLTTLVIGGGVAGWLVLGVIFLVAGAAMVPMTDWALRDRDLSDVASA